jgi:hypothetical protein
LFGKDRAAGADLNGRSKFGKRLLAPPGRGYNLGNVSFLAASLAWILACLQAVSAPQEKKPEPETAQTSTYPAYRVSIPRGYIRMAPREAGYSFERPAGREPWEKVRVDLVPLGRPLPPRTPPPVDELVRALGLEDPRNVKPLKVAWLNLQVDGVECRWARDGIEQAARIAWVPTTGQATAVCVSAPITLSSQLPAELGGFLSTFKARTPWLTEDEEKALRAYRWPAFIVPVLSGLFLLAWALMFRSRPMTAHHLRLAWHASVPVAAVAAYFLLERSAAAREKLGLEAPLYLWFLVVGPLTLFHGVMIAHRIRLAVEMGD